MEWLRSLLQEMITFLSTTAEKEKKKPLNFQNFTDDAQKVATRAMELLPKYQHRIADTGHIFLALIQDEQIIKILQSLNIDIDSTVRELEDELSDPISLAVGETQTVFITPRVKQVIENAFTEAQHLKNDWIGVEHLLLALTLDKGTALANILLHHGITHERILHTILNPDD